MLTVKRTAYSVTSVAAITLRSFPIMPGFTRVRIAPDAVAPPAIQAMSRDDYGALFRTLHFDSRAHLLKETTQARVSVDRSQSSEKWA